MPSPTPPTASPALQWPTPDRRLAYLRRLAANPFEADTAFAGRASHRELPVFALVAAGEPAPRPIHWPHIERSLELLRHRRDCQDFAMSGLLPMVYRYHGSPLLTTEQWDAIDTALLEAMYWDDEPGKHSACFTSENHQVLYHSAELLAGQRFADQVFPNNGWIGRRHREHARERLLCWLDWRTRLSFSEWNSSCYYDEDMAPLLNLVHFAEDAEIRERARAVLDLLLFHVAVNTWNGGSAHTQGRVYAEGTFSPETTPTASVADLLWGDADNLRAHFAIGAVLVAIGDYDTPPAIAAVGRAPRPGLVLRERHGCDVEDAPSFGIYPDRLRDFGFFSGSGENSHHLVVESAYTKANGQGYHYGYHYYKKCKAEGIPFDPDPHQFALTQADLYSFQTPDYVLSSAQDYRPGKPGYQQLIWQASLGGKAVVFTTNPAPADVPYGRPGPWVGNGILPRTLQHRNVLIALHRVEPYPIYDQPPWYHEPFVHAFVPQAAFYEIREIGGWCIGRRDHAWFALRPTKPARWIEPTEAERKTTRVAEGLFEWRVDDREVAWILELGSGTSDADFEAFVTAIRAAKVEGDTGHLVYESPSIGRVEAGWDRPFTVAGTEIDLHDYPRFDTPWCQAAFGSRAYDIACDGYRHRIPPPRAAE